MTDLTNLRTMTAWRQSRYGGPDVVGKADVDVPVPGPGDVLLQVRAVGLNAADHHLMRGTPLLLRLGFGLRRPKAAVRGMDVAATVVGVGPGVTTWTVGDEVMGELPGGGGLAQYAVAPASRLVSRPDALEAGTAAALPMAGGTAWQALERAAVARGQRVLVLAASGGVGHFAVQLAALRGAEVWATCGAHSRGIVAELGATRTFDYRVTDAASLPPSSFDAVIDIAGTAPLRVLRALVRPAGSVVLVAGDGGRVLGPVGRIVRGVLLSITPGPRIRPLAAVAKPYVTRELAALTATGRIRPVIERRYPLADAREALVRIDSARTVGKLVVDVAP
ncbi:NAD(P)-dependent alcohol dehydrogenase [Microbacterium rhizomatis]|uniref:NAD(P)-dependent alcohol dehydrogenase n=1 Tax=Microbacterium rhizomatis TaxID=1631477 RepID=A0A5J5J1E3_9MICO|nr:NAD(P)-dependent alcohol dehydrogenase [Microbacterium rhizomatis]KAA9108177.1 NAD(P)-dependent alcohol dehydrogenase [Microbacterium rhizomatis]